MIMKATEIVEVEPGYKIKVDTYKVMAGVKLNVYDDAEADLFVGDTFLPIVWNEKARYILENLDTVSALKFIELILEGGSSA